MKRWPKIVTTCVGVLVLLGGVAVYAGGGSLQGVEERLGLISGSENPVSVTLHETKSVKMVKPKGLPILMYHKIGDDKDNDAVIREDLFRQQMKYLKDHNYHPLTMQQLYDYVVNGAEVPENPVVLTFDDGYPDTYTVVYPILKEYGFAATIFVNPGDVGTRLTWNQIREMAASGITISNHGYMHHEMGEMTDYDQAQNVDKGREELAAELQAEPSPWFCFPYGSMNSHSEKIVKDSGVEMALSMKSGWAHAGDDPYNLKRVWVGNAVDLKHFEERLRTEHYSDV